MSDRLSSDSPQAAFEQSFSVNLLGADQARWIEQTQGYCDRLTPFTTQNQFPRILLSQTDPIEFLAGFMAACITNCPVFLGNPNWSIQEWRRVLDLVQPHLVWGMLPIPMQPQDPKWVDAREKGWIMIPTGGSSGQVKFAIHTWETLTASVQGFQDFFQVVSVNSCCVLPLYHVSGLMQFLRSFLTHGRLHIIPFANLLSGRSSDREQATFLSESSSAISHPYFLSLVPTQLQRLLQQPRRIPWLQKFSTILLGGAPPWLNLLAQAQQYQLNLAPTYGMTETASQVVTLKPQDFLQGRLDAGCVLPHAQVEILDSVGMPLAAHSIGSIVIKASSMYEGYYPNHAVQPKLYTDDLGYFDAQQYLHIAGRSSRKIISGGENIFPEEVEAALYSSGLIRDVYVLGLPDAQWGEAVIALYVPQSVEVTVQQIKDALDSSLSHYKHPKRWLVVSEIPRNAQGKMDRIRLGRILSPASTKGQNAMD